jgi:hypothetical protein
MKLSLLILKILCPEFRCKTHHTKTTSSSSHLLFSFTVSFLYLKPASPHSIHQIMHLLNPDGLLLLPWKAEQQT